MKQKSVGLVTLAAILVCLVTVGLVLQATTAQAWEPKKPIEIVIPAGQGGGADVMGRFMASLSQAMKFSKKPLVVVNKAGGSGAVAMQYLRSKKGDPHYFMISLSNVITTPLNVDLGFTWRDLTPLARLALDRHALCVNKKIHPDWKTLDDFVKAAKAGDFKLGGTGSKQEDQIVMIMLEQATGINLTYVPFKGGGTVAANLVGGHIDATVNNPSEFLGYYKSGDVALLAAFDKNRVPGYPEVPTMKELGHPEAVYEMLRATLMPPDVPDDAVAYMADLIKKITDTQGWKEYTDRFMLQRAYLAGPELTKWLIEYEELHKGLLKKGGLIK